MWMTQGSRGPCYSSLSLWTEALVKGEGAVAPTLRTAVRTWELSRKSIQFTVPFRKLQPLQIIHFSRNPGAHLPVSHVHCRSCNLPLVSEAVNCSKEGYEYQILWSRSKSIIPLRLFKLVTGWYLTRKRLNTLIAIRNCREQKIQNRWRIYTWTQFWEHNLNFAYLRIEFCIHISFP